MNPFIELMQAGALIMLLFAVVLISVVIRNLPGSKGLVRWGPALIGVGLLFFAVPIYASVIGTDDFDRYTSVLRIVGAVLLPIGLYLLGAVGEQGLGRYRRDGSETNGDR